MVEVAAAPILQRWVSFYQIVGEAAASLTGLQFVVIALFTQMRIRNNPSGLGAFSTPTIVYFSMVLFLASILCAPWSGLAGAAALVAVCGAVGTAYCGFVMWRLTRQTAYRLVVEDWVWHITFPLGAQMVILISGLAMLRWPVAALFAIAAALLLLLLIGIHNAWDTVTYLVLTRPEAPLGEQPEGTDAQPAAPARSEAAAALHDGER